MSAGYFDFMVWKENTEGEWDLVHKSDCIHRALSEMVEADDGRVVYVEKRNWSSADYTPIASVNVPKGWNINDYIWER